MHKNLKLALDLSPYLRYLHISCSYTKDMGNRKDIVRSLQKSNGVFRYPHMLQPV
jgi:hypothetical protein